MKRNRGERVSGMRSIDNKAGEGERGGGREGEASAQERRIELLQVRTTNR